jgi:hypothetical protein
MMNQFREILIEKRPFRIFQLLCSECNEEIISVTDLTDSPLKNEALVIHSIEQHSFEQGHYSFDGNIEPAHALQHIDTTITINEDLK